MKLVIMQPYLFPYIGYFQLMQAADKFVIYDDVNYIKGGWVNRNRILVNGQPFMFTLPLKNAGSNIKINAIEVGGNEFIKWREKFLRMLQQAYAKAPFRNEVIALVDDVLKEDRNMLGDLLRRSLQIVIDRLSINIDLVPTSSIFSNSDLSGAERVLDICAREKANVYVNAIGGKELYSQDQFRSHGVKLHFLRSNPLPFTSADRIQGLSILDLMMWETVTDIAGYLRQYDLE